MQYMLSTVDNPYDPLTQYDEWYAYDESSGYCSTGLLARITRTSDEMSDADQQQAIEAAIDEIVQENVLGIFIKVSSSE